MTSMLRVAAALIALCITASALCGRPQPRSLCAEYSQSNAVVIATLVRSRHVTPKGDQDYRLYTFKIEQVLRGKITQEFILWDENSSARLPFDTHAGHKYLLFMNEWTEKGWWTADGCGHSGDLSMRANTFQQLASYSAKRYAQITGEAPYSGTSVTEIVALNKSTGKKYETRTDRNGAFKLRVPPGDYTVQARDKKLEYTMDPFSYEDAHSIALENGGCAQIQFDSAEPPNRTSR